jgi:hypothetical protein
MLRALHQLRNLTSQLRLNLAGMSVAQGTAFGRTRFDLGAVKTDLADVEHFELFRYEQDLHEDIRQIRQGPPAEVSDRIVIRARIGCNIAEDHGIEASTLQLARAKDPCRITIKQQRDEHLRAVRPLAATGIRRLDPGKFMASTQSTTKRARCFGPNQS